MIDNSYDALSYILRNNSAITDLLGFFPNSTIPIVNGGVLAESVTDLPAITFTTPILDVDFNIEDNFYTVNCYAETERESFVLARTVVKQLNGLDTCADGYPVTTTAKIIAIVPDPTANEINTAVEVRLFNIGGAL